MQQNHGDQDWISKRGKEDINWFPDEWIRSYKWEMIGFKDTKLLTKDGKKWFREPVKINQETGWQCSMDHQTQWNVQING